MESREPISVDEEVAALSRGADRDSLFMQANITVAGQAGPTTIRVRNLSIGGMLAEGHARVAQGLAVTVELRNVGAVPGRVIWVGEGKFGIAFDHQVNPQAVRRQVGRKPEAATYVAAFGGGPSYRPR